MDETEVTDVAGGCSGDSEGWSRWCGQPLWWRSMRVVRAIRQRRRRLPQPKRQIKMHAKDPLSHTYLSELSSYDGQSFIRCFTRPEVNPHCSESLLQVWHHLNYCRAYIIRWTWQLFGYAIVFGRNNTSLTARESSCLHQCGRYNIIQQIIGASRVFHLLNIPYSVHISKTTSIIITFKVFIFSST